MSVSVRRAIGRQRMMLRNVLVAKNAVISCDAKLSER